MLDDDYFMREAIAEGEKGRTTAPPNPWVGAILVKDGRIVGRGFHNRPGEPHAEIMAIRSSEDVSGSTIYCTLEPCSHHGRTGPCCEALAVAGIVRCVIGVVDPDPKVSGKGIEYLTANGVRVDYANSQLVKESLRPYLHHRRTGFPYVVIKTGISIDGKIACGDHSSQWITGPEARAEGHQIRHNSCAILVGSGTVLDDNPRLTVRCVDGVCRQPIRVVIDRQSRLRHSPTLNIFSGDADTIVYTNSDVEDDYYPFHVRIFRDKHWTLDRVFKSLGSLGIIQLMVEGGSSIHSAIIAEKLFNELVVFVGSTLLGSSALPFMMRPICETITNAEFLELREVKQLGNDVKLTYGRNNGHRI